MRQRGKSVMKLASTPRGSDSQGRPYDALQSDSEDLPTPKNLRVVGIARDGNVLAPFGDVLKEADFARVSVSAIILG